MFQNYLKIAWRNIWRNKIFTLINVVGLALGISVCLAIVLLIRFEASYDNFHKDSDRIYRLYFSLKFGEQDWRIPAAPVPMGLHLKEDMPDFEQVVPFQLVGLDRVEIKQGTKVKTFKKNPEKTVIVVTPAYFEMFKYQWVVGNPKTALEKPFQVVLTEKEAQKYFPNTSLSDIYGKNLTYIDNTDTVQVSVSGIVKTWQGNTDFNFTDFVSYPTLKLKWKQQISYNSWDNVNSNSQLFIKPHKITNIKTLPERMRKYLLTKSSSKHNPAKEASLHLQPLRDLHFNPELSSEYARIVDKNVLNILVGVGALLLIIACINFINLSTAQASQRAKEVGIRKSLGSSRLQLIGQFLSETAIIVFVAILLSWLLLPQILLLLQWFIANSAPVPLFVGDLLLVSLLIFVVTVPLAGFYPAFVLSRANALQSLRNQVVYGSSRKAYLRKSLIIFQFTVTQIFIILLLVIYSQVNFMMGKDIGFDKTNIAYLFTPWNEAKNKKFALFNDLKQLSGIKEIILDGGAPCSENMSSNSMQYNGVDVPVHQKYGDDAYMGFYKLKLLAGRNITTSDTTKEVIVNEMFIRKFGLGSPEKAIGKTVKMNEKLYPIVGVMNDFNVTSLHQPMQSVCLSSNDFRHVISIRNLDKKILPDIKKIWQKHYKDSYFEVKYLEETIERFYENDVKFSQLISACMIIAAFISCIGLFGLSIFTTTQRTKEIGIRKIHGASIQNIVLLLSRDFLTLVLVAFVMASGVAYWLSGEFLKNYPFSIDISWWMFILTLVGASAIALFTVSYHAIRVARNNPVNALRNE
jgi:ABC-type antimicrobial peptide transport system permease subunit